MRDHWCRQILRFIVREDGLACSCAECIGSSIRLDQDPEYGGKRWKGRAKVKRMIDRAYAVSAAEN
jgi:hypothetical protein